MIKIDNDEKLIAVYRRHIIVILLALLPMVFFSIVIVFSTYTLLASSLIAEGSLLGPVILFLAIVFLHIFWIASFISITDYYLDVWILTDKRVIAIEQKNLFSRTLYEFELSKIQEVGVDVRGFLQTIIDFGDVRVSTASENPDFKFKQVGNPNVVKDAIMDAVESDRMRKA